MKTWKLSFTTTLAIAAMSLSGCSQRQDRQAIIQVKTYISKETGQRTVYVSERFRQGNPSADTGAFEEIVHFSEGASGSVNSENYEVIYSFDEQGTRDNLLIINIRDKSK